MNSRDVIFLTDKQDPTYLRMGSFYRANLEKNRIYGKDPLAEDTHRLYRILEEQTLNWLRKICGASPELVLWSPKKNGGSQESYPVREIDFVVWGDPTTPALFGELKFSSDPSRALYRARNQLRKSLHIARQRWPGLRGACICFQTGGSGDSPQTPSKHTGAVSQIPEFLANTSDAAVSSAAYPIEPLLEILTQGELPASFFGELMAARAAMDHPVQTLLSPHSFSTNSMAHAFETTFGIKESGGVVSRRLSSR